MLAREVEKENLRMGKGKTDTKTIIIYEYLRKSEWAQYLTGWRHRKNIFQCLFFVSGDKTEKGIINQTGRLEPSVSVSVFTVEGE